MEGFGGNPKAGVRNRLAIDILRAENVAPAALQGAHPEILSQALAVEVFSCHTHPALK